MKRGSSILFLGLVLLVLFLVGVVSAYQCSDCKDFKILDSATDAKGVKKNFGVPCDGKIRAYADNDNFYVGVKIPNQARKQTLYICDGGPNDEGIRRCDPSKGNNICCGGIGTYVPNGGGLICDREGTKVASFGKNTPDGKPNECAGNGFKKNWVDVKQGDILEMIPGSAGENPNTYWVEFKATGTCEGVPTTGGNGVPQCSDGIDNDGDGKIDALTEGGDKNNCGEIRYSNGETNCDRYGDSYYFGRTKNQASSEVDNFVNSFEEYTNIYSAGDTWCNQITANKVCELAGYKTAQTINLRAEGEFTNNDCSNSKCSQDRSCRGWHSRSDNYFAYWDESKNDFVNEKAKGATVGSLNRGIEKLLCTNPISACNDGIDNDGDGKIDYSSVLAVDSGSLDFHSVHAPPHFDASVTVNGRLYNLRFDDPDYSTWEVEDKCMLPVAGTTVKASNGIFPREISDSDKYSPGNILKISNPSGNICLRVWKGQYDRTREFGGIPNGPPGTRGSSCKDCCGRYFVNYCGEAGKSGKQASDYSARDYTNSNIKIGFYTSNAISANNLPIEEYEFNSFVGNDIKIPGGTKYIYVYYISPSATRVHAYGSNNAAFKISFDFEIVSEGDDGCASKNDNSEVPHDPQCDNLDDNTEEDPVTQTQCNDGIDNDGDGDIDLDDSDCDDSNDPLEETTQCNDGYDNDKDGSIDLADSDCTDGNDPLEGTTQCNDGIDNDGDGDIDLDDSDCDDSNDPTEGVDQCKDDYDNDVDGDIDLDDSDCENEDDPLEGPTQCNDGLDNDGDGDIDLDDSDCDDSNDPTEGVYVPGVLGITDAHWEDMNGVPITTSDLNDNVKLVVSGVEFEGKTINFEIREKESLLGIDWLWPDSIIADLSDIGFTIWRAGQNSELTSGEYYFIATIEGVEKISNNLVVSNSKDNSDPEIEILSPKDKQIYFKDEELLFRAKVSDDDDLDLNWEWDLGEGNEIRTGAIRSGEFIEFNYAYPTGGQKNMVLIVDDGREGIGRSQISIIAIASKYILAYIDSPLHGEVINQGEVVLDASSVYSVEETRDENNIRTITCLKGFCPEYTEGCPPELAGLQAGKDSCPSDNDNKCCLNVLNDPLETGLAPDYSDIEFKWDFHQDDGGEYVLVANKIVFDNPITNYLFPRADFYKTILTTSINPSSSASTNFYLDFEIPTPTCKLIESENDVTSAKPKEVFVGESYWEINSVLKRTNDGSEANCYQADGVQSDGVDNENFDNTCCPGLSICNPESGVCEFNTEPELGCAQFTEDNCDGNTNIAKNDLITTIGDNCLKTEEIQQLGSSCIKYKRCYCEWVETEDGSGTCGATSEEVFTASCKRKTPKGKCTITHIDSGGSCDTEGYIIAKWIGTWKVDGVVSPNTGQCPAEGTTTFDCKDVAKLGFFSMFNFIIAILSIITIYGIMLRKED